MPTRMRGAEALGHLRLEMGERLELRTPGVLAYVWIHHFPMFKWDADGKRWDATHNPFSAPVWEEERRLESDPGAVHAQQYDLALNGWELGGGSIRIHRRDLLERAFALMGHSRRGDARPVRRPARRARVRGAAARRDRHRPGPMGSAATRTRTTSAR